jgi:hypothetical protein
VLMLSRFSPMTPLKTRCRVRQIQIQLGQKPPRAYADLTPKRKTVVTRNFSPGSDDAPPV